MRVLLTVLAWLAAVLVAHAAEWQTYANDRYGYTIELPPGFTMQRAPGNGDGGTFLAKNGDRILVFGTFLVDVFFDEEAANRITQAKKDGWKISYSRVKPEWASYSGTRGDRILYVRGIWLCEDAATFLQLEYRKQDLKTYDMIIKRMVASLKPAGCPQ
ncbi:hypothetical protein [Neorhizobium petrolearium]|uniref:CNP1-like uncharacterized domain-containing protein n=1 Tax=Neorhizobium petrolearium TaxID=515361 RepID=A0ABY8M3U0_9HYPH|nr:hypothetical protein [Neorhizobium petrolearium]MCC2608981.1 hypothetical protein [Neorhizobium petrolearium]WGI69223.1 hypothetical protein QEO92_03800 [Neorhizobium petrolearium]